MFSLWNRLQIETDLYMPESNLEIYDWKEKPISWEL